MLLSTLLRNQSLSTLIIFDCSMRACPALLIRRRHLDLIDALYSKSLRIARLLALTVYEAVRLKVSHPLLLAKGTSKSSLSKRMCWEEGEEALSC
jgi:hypothetical protein